MPGRLSGAAADPDLEGLAGDVRESADHEPVMRRGESVHDRRIDGGHFGRVYLHQAEIVIMDGRDVSGGTAQLTPAIPVLHDEDGRESVLRRLPGQVVV